MEIVLSVAVSLDGYIDDDSDERLVLSSEEDLADVYVLRSECDAILVGSGTVRTDNPSLVTKSNLLRGQRLAAGKSADPLKVTATQSGNLDPHAKFFQDGSGNKLVYCPDKIVGNLRNRLGDLTEVVGLGEVPIRASDMARNLERRGVKKLMVEGGAQMLNLYLGEGVAHHLRLALAPFFVQAQTAPQFARGLNLPFTSKKPMKVINVRQLGETTVLDFSLDISS